MNISPPNILSKAKSAKLGFADEFAIPEAKEGEEVPKADASGTLNIADIKWAKKALPKGAVGKEPSKLTDVVKAGDIILVQRKPRAKTDKSDKRITAYNLRQVPKVNGGLIAMDPHTGRVLALVGGYSFEQSQFNKFPLKVKRMNFSPKKMSANVFISRPIIIQENFTALAHCVSVLRNLVTR